MHYKALSNNNNKKKKGVIILKKRKTYEISVIDKTYSKIIFDETKFYTSDTALELSFELKETEYIFESAEIVLLNVDDRSLATRQVSKTNDGFVYEIDDDVTSHYGEWRGQLMLVENGEVHVSSPIKFRIENDLYCNKPLEIIEVVSWVNLKRYADSLTEELKQAVMSVEGIEGTFNANELERQTTFETNESERDETFNGNETTRQSQELEREEAESQRQTVFEENESVRTETFNANETTRQENEDARIEAEKQREGTVSKIENRQDTVENKFDLLQQEMTDKDPISAPEIIAARGDEPTLSARLDKEQQEINTQLAQTAKKDLTRNISDSSVVNIANKESRIPLVTFIDDDGAIDVYTRLKPIFESRGVPCTIGIVSDWVGKEQVGNFSKAMTQEQILELQNLGWEIASHSKTHIPLSGVNDKKIIRQELRESKKKLLELGFDVKNYVYPYGHNNSTVREEVAKIYKVATQTNILSNDETNASPLNNTRLKRVALGSYGGSNDTLEHHKSVIDRAISENSWVIFMTHVWAQDEEKDQLIADLIDYIKSASVDIVTLDEGLDVFGDKVNINGVFRVLPDNSILSDTNIFIASHTNPTVEEINDFNFFANNFNDNHIIYSLFNTNSVVGMPQNKGGVLKTTRLTRASGFSEQEYIPYNSDRVWRRKLTPNRTWSKWTSLNFEKYSGTSAEIEFETVPAQSSKTINVPVADSFTSTDIAVSRPYFGLPSGIVYDCRPLATGNVQIRLTNITSVDVAIPKDRWSIKVFLGNL